MKNFFGGALLLLGALVLSGCSGIGGGESASAPPDVKVIPGDGGATITWTMESGVEYWVFSAAAPSVSPESWASLPQAKVVRNGTSPQIVTGLTNGTTYSFTVNGRKSGGPGGSGSPSISIIPRLAGLVWTLGTPLASTNLKGLGFAFVIYPGIYVTVGAGGTAFGSVDAITWTAVTTGVTADLNAVAYGGGNHVAVGAGGTVINSLDALAWTTRTSGTTNDLNSIVLGSNGLVAVGNNGAVLRSNDGGNGWVVGASGTTANLYGVAFGSGRYIAVGAGGTVLTSADGDTWTAQTSGTTRELRSVAYSAARTLYAAVGANGTIITSPDAVTWTSLASVTTNTLNSVNYGNQFTVAGNAGTILVSTDGVTFQAVPSGTTSNLNAVLFGLLGYGIVGVGGVNLSSY